MCVSQTFTTLADLAKAELLTTYWCGKYPGSRREETQRGDTLSFDSFREVEWQRHHGMCENQRKKARQEQVCATDERDQFKNVSQIYTWFYGTWLWSSKHFKIIIHQRSRIGSPGINSGTYGQLWSVTKKARIYNGEKTVSLISGTGKLDSYEWKIEHYQMPYTKTKSKWFKDLNVRPGTIKLFMENKKNTLWHKSQQDLFWPTSYSNENKNKNKAMGPNLT